jgi:hypothetical protein
MLLLSLIINGPMSPSTPAWKGGVAHNDIHNTTE